MPYGLKYRYVKQKDIGVHLSPNGMYVVRVMQPCVVNGRNYGSRVTTLKQFKTEKKAQKFYDDYLAKNEL